MAEVFEAEREGAHGFARRVAIKRILPQIAAAPETCARFLEEARIASTLHHAGIVAILDFGVMDDLPFQVLELVDGLDASELASRAGGTLPLDLALIITADVAHALDHAHEARDADGHLLGIVHRDVKPANVLVAWSGDVKLGDFGIAFAHGRAVHTEAGVAPGTWAFMAPEQRLRGAVDRRADVFALGCTLHALLTGRSPAEALERAGAATSADELPLADELPDDVRALIARAVALAPQARFPTAAALAEALGTALAARLTRDPRGRLRELLEPLRDVPAPRAGLLDHLLAVELVLTSDRGELRRFEARPMTERVPPPLMPAQEAPVAPLAPRAEEPATAPMRRGRRSARVALAALVVGGVALVVAGLITPSSTRRAPAAATAAPTVSAAEPAPTTTSPTRRDAEPEPEQEPEPEPAQPSHPAAGDRLRTITSPTTPPERTPTNGRRKPRTDTANTPPDTADTTPAHPSLTDTPPAPTEPPAALATGYLKVVPRQRGDRSLLNARIYVDGVLRGYSPDPIAAPVGTHKVRVVLDDDTTEVGTYSVEVTANHRERGHPATLAVP